MLGNIVTVGPLLAGVSALVALALTLTKTAFLRRREESLRKIKDSLGEGTRHHAAVSQLHRTIVAALVARQVLGSWRFIWPWLAWLIITGTAAQSGFYLGKYVESGDPFDLSTFAFEVFGGDAPALFLMPVLFIVLALVFRSYEHSLLERARTTRDFYNTGAINPRPAVLTGFMRERRKGFWGFIASLTPGLCAFAVGLAAGINTYLRVVSQVGTEPTSLTYTAFWTNLAAVGLLVATGSIAADVRAHRRDIELLPRPRVPKALRHRRLRANLGLNTHPQRREESSSGS